MTSIEWFYNEIKHIIPNDFLGKFEQAKEMHKQDIITAYAFGHNDGCRYMTNEKQEFEHGEGYYKETFKKD